MKWDRLIWGRDARKIRKGQEIIKFNDFLLISDVLNEFKFQVFNVCIN